MPNKLTVDMSGLNAAMEAAADRFAEVLRAKANRPVPGGTEYRLDRGALVPIQPPAETIPSAWQPIHTAPKDGTRILTKCHHHEPGDCGVTQWDAKCDEWMQVLCTHGDAIPWTPDEWAPIPK